MKSSDLDNLAEHSPASFATGGFPDRRSTEILTRWRKRLVWQRTKRDDDDEPPPVPVAIRTVDLCSAWS